jgi:hypothetical protein
MSITRTIDARKPTIQVDFDCMALGKFHGVNEPIWHDIGITTALLRGGLTSEPSCTTSGPFSRLSSVWLISSASGSNSAFGTSETIDDWESWSEVRPKAETRGLF